MKCMNISFSRLSVNPRLVVTTVVTRGLRSYVQGNHRMVQLLQVLDYLLT
jgi:hypothetical protein